MHPSWAKTKIQNLGVGTPDPPVVVNGAVVESVEEFVHLNSLQLTDIWPAADIVRRREIAAGSMRKLDNIWLSRKIKMASKVRIYKSCIVTILLYGSETWTFTKACPGRLQAFHMRCQRQLLGVCWDDFVSNVRHGSERYTQYHLHKTPGPVGPRCEVGPFSPCMEGTGPRGRPPCK